jgi:hypothetical protein
MMGCTAAAALLGYGLGIRSDEVHAVFCAAPTRLLHMLGAVGLLEVMRYALW